MELQLGIKNLVLLLQYQKNMFYACKYLHLYIMNKEEQQNDNRSRIVCKGT